MKQTFQKIGEGIVINKYEEDFQTYKKQFEQIKQRRELQTEVRMLKLELEAVKKTLSQLLTDKVNGT